MKALIATLVQAFHQDASFGANEAGYLKVTLEPAVIEQRFLELVESSRAPYRGRCRSLLDLIEYDTYIHSDPRPIPEHVRAAFDGRLPPVAT